MIKELVRNSVIMGLIGYVILFMIADSIIQTNFAAQYRQRNKKAHRI